MTNITVARLIEQLRAHDETTDIDKLLARSGASSALDMWGRLRDVGGMPPLQPEHVREIVHVLYWDKKEARSADGGHWQPIETAPHGIKVLVCGTIPGYGHPITTVARYWPEHTLEVAKGCEDEDRVDIGDSGTAYMPADWYEEYHCGDGPAVNLTPTHWMPLPAPEKGK